MIQTGDRLEVVALAETFTSIQGEGVWTGTPMFFIRFAGCNLSCQWCDTDHMATEVVRVRELIRRAESSGHRRVCITGGEPTFQPEAFVSLVEGLRAVGLAVHVETNGTGHVPEDVQWTTVSPKVSPLPLVPKICDELKCVIRVGEQLPDRGLLLVAHHYYLVPEASQGKEAVQWVIGLVMEPNDLVPPWILGIQVHKLIGMP